MTFSSRARGVIVACLLIMQTSASQPLAAQTPSTPVVRFDAAKGVFLLEGWTALSQQKPEQLVDLFTISIDKPDVPPLLGKHSIVNGALVFTPQYPIQDGVLYKAVARIPGMPAISLVTGIPKRVVQPTTVVANVYPTTNVLPENQLKFYIYFSASMSQGDAFDHVKLLNEAGVPIPDPPFLPRGGELWDRDFKRFTLFFDPGRVKRDLGPSLAMGPALVEGKRYTLVIDREWVDANGVPMKEDFRKTFSVGPPDRKPLDLATWKIIAPKSGTTEPVAVEFSESMDHAITLRELDVLDASGKAVEGAVTLDRSETRWRLTPSTPWKKGSYTLQVGEVTADLAGNMVGKPFEVDLFEKIDERLVRQTRDLPFKID